MHRRLLDEYSFGAVQARHKQAQVRGGKRKEGSSKSSTVKTREMRRTETVSLVGGEHIGGDRKREKESGEGGGELKNSFKGGRESTDRLLFNAQRSEKKESGGGVTGKKQDHFPPTVILHYMAFYEKGRKNS